MATLTWSAQTRWEQPASETRAWLSYPEIWWNLIFRFHFLSVNRANRVSGRFKIFTPTSCFLGGELVTWAPIGHGRTHLLVSPCRIPSSQVTCGSSMCYSDSCIRQVQVFQMGQSGGVCNPCSVRWVLLYCFFSFPGWMPALFGMNNRTVKQSTWFPQTHEQVTFKHTSTNICAIVA